MSTDHNYILTGQGVSGKFFPYNNAGGDGVGPPPYPNIFFRKKYANHRGWVSSAEGRGKNMLRTWKIFGKTILYTRGGVGVDFRPKAENFLHMDFRPKAEKNFFTPQNFEKF